MQTITASLLAIALTFTGGGLAVAHSQQLQSDGTMSQPQQAAPPQSPLPAAPAQSGPRHVPNPARQAKHLSKQLGLLPDQTAQLQPILADRDARMAALHSSTALTPRDMHQQGRAIEMDADSKIKALLTPAQQQQYADMRAAHHHGQHAAPPAPGI